MLSHSQLPGLSAFDVVRQLRSAELALGEPRVVVIGVTGTLDAPILAACKDAGENLCEERLILSSDSQPRVCCSSLLQG